MQVKNCLMIINLDEHIRGYPAMVLVVDRPHVEHLARVAAEHPDGSGDRVTSNICDMHTLVSTYVQIPAESNYAVIALVPKAQYANYPDLPKVFYSNGSEVGTSVCAALNLLHGMGLKRCAVAGVIGEHASTQLSVWLDRMLDDMQEQAEVEQ